MITPARTAAVPILSRSCGLTGCGRSIGQLSDKDIVPLQLHPCAADRPTSSIGQPRYDNGYCLRNIYSWSDHVSRMLL
jgi:hypothetical protein